MLKPHAPSSPTRPPVEHLYFVIFDPDNEQQRYFTHGFGAFYAAYHWLDRVMKHAKVKWINDNTIELTRKKWRMVVKGSNIQDILEAKYTKEELAWTPPHPDSIALQHLVDFHIPASPISTSIEEPKKPVKTKDTKSSSKSSLRPGHKLKPELKGHVSVTHLSQEYNLTPAKARGILRKAGIKKPANGWTFKKGDPMIDQIKSLFSSQ